MGTDPGLRPVVDRYRQYTVAIQFLWPPRRDREAELGRYYYPLKISFDRRGLARATEVARANSVRFDAEH